VPVSDTAPRLLTLAMKPLGRRQLQSVRVTGGMSWRAADMHYETAWGAGLLLAVKKCLEAKGREDEGFPLLSPSLQTSVAKVLFVIFSLVPRPEPAPCPLVGVTFEG